MSTIIKTLGVLVLLTQTVSAADYTGMAAGLALAARTNGITRVALGTFSGSENEARFAREKAAGSLAGERDLEVLDQETIQDFAGSKDGWLAKMPAKLRPQAFIKGSVFQEGEELTVMIKLVDARSGRVLKAVEMKSRARFTELPPVPEIDWGAPVAAAPVRDDFRDAPADKTGGCEGAFRDMSRLNAAAVDLKARYWARKMKEPGFTLGALTRNPGSEIRDPQVKQKFYDLLSRYHGQEELPALPEARTKQLEDFMAREDGVIDRCGIK